MEALQRAIDALSEKGYCCSQILALLILGAQGKENEDLVRALAGLCHGIGQSGSTCGILTGGCCVLSYLVGPNTENDTGMAEAKIILEEYVDWFNDTCSKKWGSSLCSEIIGDENPEGPNKKACRELLTSAWVRLLGILTMHQIAYASPNDSKIKSAVTPKP